MTITTHHIDPRFIFDPLDALDDEIPYPDWMEEDLYSDDADDYRDYAEEAYNEMLMDGGDL